MNQIFKSLKKDDYEEGAKHALKNANNLLEVSDEAAKINNFGIAKSLLVLAAEELAKASILKIKSIDGSIEVKNLDKYFFSHKTKHDSLLSVFSSSLIFLEDEEKGDDIYKEAEKRKSENKSSNLILGTVILAIVGFIGFSYLMTKKSKAPTKTANRKKKTYFNEIKESGFYVGFNEGQMTWEVPNQIHDKKNYQELRDFIQMTFDTIQQSLFDGKIKEDNIVKFIQNLNDDMIDTSFVNRLKGKLKQ